jgi:hypothetical protein
MSTCCILSCLSFGSCFVASRNIHISIIAATPVTVLQLMLLAVANRRAILLNCLYITNTHPCPGSFSQAASYDVSDDMLIGSYECPRTLGTVKEQGLGPREISVRLSLCIDNMGTSAPTNSCKTLGLRARSSSSAALVQVLFGSHGAPCTRTVEA